jgi:hypothetical protein
MLHILHDGRRNDRETLPAAFRSPGAATQVASVVKATAVRDVPTIYQLRSQELSAWQDLGSLSWASDQSSTLLSLLR